MEQDSHNANLHDGDSVDARSAANITMPREPTPSVVKNLFPDPEVDREANREKTMEMLKDFITIDAERMRTKWNFDVENDRPLDGAVKWKKGDDHYSWIGFRAGSDEGNGEITEAQVNGEIEGGKRKSA